MSAAQKKVNVKIDIGTPLIMLSVIIERFCERKEERFCERKVERFCERKVEQFCERKEER